MEKKRFLDACSKAAILTALTALLVSCTLPRIIVLDDPLTPQEHIDLALSYEQRGEFEAALKEYQTAARDIPLSYLYIGNVFFQRKEYDAAEKAYKRAIEKTGNAHACNNLAWLYYTTGAKLDEAETLARKAVELSPDHAGFADTLDKIRAKLRR